MAYIMENLPPIKPRYQIVWSRAPFQDATSNITAKAIAPVFVTDAIVLLVASLISTGRAQKALAEGDERNVMRYSGLAVGG